MAELHEYSTESACYAPVMAKHTHVLSGLRWRDAIAMVVLLQGPLPAFGQMTLSSCIPPEPPYTALPEVDLREFRTELKSDFESYFNDISPFIACLDEERARVMAEGAELANAYKNFLKATTNDENR